MSQVALSVAQPPSFAVLMATYNGASYLDEQLDSISRQNVPRIDVWASDDGSSDGTRRVLDTWRAKWSKGSFSIADGPQRGFAENFRFLTLTEGISADYVAFSDQDDIWDEDKLAIAVDMMAADGSSPALYFSRTRLVTSKGRRYGMSPLFARPPALRNALVESIGGGNTMVLNAKAFELFAESCRRTEFVFHDWWAYIICTAAGGTVRYDPHPHMDYRQHPSNLVGANGGIKARFYRPLMLMAGRFAGWNDKNLTGLSRCENLIRPDALEIIEQFRFIRSRPGLAAIFRLNTLGIYRQTLLGNIGLRFSAVFGKM